MNRSILAMKVGGLELGTSTVENGVHFRKIRNLIDDLIEDEFIVSINSSKWILTQMLELENRSWDDDAKEIYLLLHNQLIKNIK